MFDTDGKMIAQAVTGTPGHVNSMALSVGHFLRRHPVETMQPGDVFLTNDPWLATGHLFDFTVVSPAFRNGRLVALFACTAHVVDVGGIGFGADGRQVFEEGICIPIMPLARAGTLNQAVFDILEANVREPLQVRGDLHSLAACNEMGCRRLVEMMDEFALDDLADLAAVILANSRTAMLAEIARLPAGNYRHSMVVDGFERPITLHANMRVRHDGIHVDYTGTSPCSARGINVPLAYTTAYTAFGIRCMVGAGILNNAGSLAPITVHAPPGCILNAPRPHAVSARQVVGQMLPDLLFGCLHQVVPDGAPAEGAASLWSVPLFGGPGIGADGDDARPGTPFTVMGIVAGGTGARPRQDGLSATAFPSRVRGIPIEISGNARASGVLDQGAAPGFGRRRHASRRPGSDRRDRLSGGRIVRDVARHLRPHPVSGARTGGWQRGWLGLDRPRLRPALRRQVPSRGSSRRTAGHAVARRWRIRSAGATRAARAGA